MIPPAWLGGQSKLLFSVCTSSWELSQLHRVTPPASYSFFWSWWTASHTVLPLTFGALTYLALSLRAPPVNSLSHFSLGLDLSLDITSSRKFIPISLSQDKVDVATFSRATVFWCHLAFSTQAMLQAGTLFCSLIHSQHLRQYLANNQHLINICWMSVM